ncbi:hypothetical protein C2845_PM01G02150 [Panicum miliaceum]|uniref:Uncharacterized protein n=1 Tax=Panicum miliaceum TaxID=4540 RepID=A0A3L6TG51_PANMI|nr:hypothetical protein C2845_PM01G02150 [Panicum miliaceum]
MEKMVASLICSALLLVPSKLTHSARRSSSSTFGRLRVVGGGASGRVRLASLAPPVDELGARSEHLDVGVHPVDLRTRRGDGPRLCLDVRRLLRQGVHLALPLGAGPGSGNGNRRSSCYAAKSCFWSATCVAANRWLLTSSSRMSRSRSTRCCSIAPMFAPLELRRLRSHRSLRRSCAAHARPRRPAAAERCCPRYAARAARAVPPAPVHALPELATSELAGVLLFPNSGGLRREGAWGGRPARRWGR